MKQPSLFSFQKASDLPNNHEKLQGCATKSSPLDSPSLSIELNPRQQEAVKTVNGPVLVIAGAGSGKTRTLVHRLVHLVENGVSPENILLLTFTRKASQEMISRGVSLLGDSCHKVMGGTFHSVANLLLRRYAHVVEYASNFTILDRADAEGIINLLKSSLGFTGTGKRFPAKRVILNMISGAVNKSRSFEEIVETDYFHLTEFINDLNKIRIHYQQFKRDHCLMDYDDLLVYLLKVLEQNQQARQEISSRFRYIMVDEYQDTNHIQAAIVRLIASDHDNVMVVGDDSQSIYSFRGADFRNIMDFPQVFPGTKIIRLEQNYRSSQEILEATNAIIAQAREKYTKKLFSTISGGKKPLLYGAKDEGEQAAYVLKMIKKRHDEGIAYHDMAVLFRSGFHSYKLEMELNNHHIRFEKRGGLKLTETAHIKDVVSYLRLVSNDADSLSWNRVLLQLPKVGPKTAQKIVDVLRQSADSLAALKKYKPAPAWKNGFLELVDMLTELREKNTPLAQFETVMEYYQPVLENLYHDDYHVRSRDLEQLKAIIGDYQSLQAFLDDTVLDPPESSFDAFADPQQDTLVLSTVHSAKGLEWDTVFVIHLAEGKFPSCHAAAFPDQMEEERRLLYVASTRAKSRLFLTYPRETVAPDRSRQYSTISPFLAELPPRLIENQRPNFSPRFSEYDNSLSSFSDSESVSKKVYPAKMKKNDESQSGPLNSTDSLAIGMSVRHGFFGVGQIRKIKGDKTVDVFFARHGLKSLRLDYAKLEFA